MRNVSFIQNITAAVCAGTLLLSVSARADKQVSTVFDHPVRVDATVDTSGCKNSGGPTVTFGGRLTLGGLNTRITFSNNAKGTHTATVVGQFDVTLLPEGSAIEIPKQPVRGGVGGNPHIYLQFHNGSGGDLSEEFYLGRCVQGQRISADLLSEAIARATVQAGGCENSGGPFITLGGDITLSGLHARFIFRNNVKGTHTAEAARDVAIVLEGSTITLPKQPVLGGVGGNPIISLQFLDGNGDPIDDPVVLGRCNKI
jgi:hypothetical protein